MPPERRALARRREEPAKCGFRNHRRRSSSPPFPLVTLDARRSTLGLFLPTPPTHEGDTHACVRVFPPETRISRLGYIIRRRAWRRGPAENEGEGLAARVRRRRRRLLRGRASDQQEILRPLPFPPSPSPSQERRTAATTTTTTTTTLCVGECCRAAVSALIFHKDILFVVVFVVAATRLASETSRLRKKRVIDSGEEDKKACWPTASPRLASSQSRERVVVRPV